MSRLVTPKSARWLYGFNALVAWSAVLLSFTLNITGFYSDNVNPDAPTLLGNVVGGQDQPWERLFDWLTYFTILSNIVVAVVMTALLLRPDWFNREDSTGRVWRALRLDSVVMILVTGIVYNVLLAEGPKTGIDWVNNFQQHALNPVVTLLVFAIAGPKRLASWRTAMDAMVLPLLWSAFALLRGQVIGAYPYFFLNVAELGIAAVLLFIAQILVFALLLCAGLILLDRVTAKASIDG